jgi:ParB-like chromosome segregation protein Spo0J
LFEIVKNARCAEQIGEAMPSADPKTNYRELSVHPLAEIFPLMEGEEFERLADDIKANGLQEPITLFEGKILDGRNRYRALEKAGMSYRLKDENFRQYSGSDPLGFVISANIHRRHLNESQRAIFGASLVTRKLGDNQHKSGYSIEQAAKLLCIGETSVKAAKEVLEKGVPEIQKLVREGKARLGGLTDIVRLDQSQQVAELNKIKQQRQAEARAKRDAKKNGQPAVPQVNQAMKDVDDFKAKWVSFNDMQHKAFVMSFEKQLAGLLEYVRQQKEMASPATPSLG